MSNNRKEQPVSNCSIVLNPPINPINEPKRGLYEYKQPLSNVHNLFLVLNITPQVAFKSSANPHITIQIMNRRSYYTHRRSLDSIQRTF